MTFDQTNKLVTLFRSEIVVHERLRPVPGFYNRILSAAVATTPTTVSITADHYRALLREQGENPDDHMQTIPLLPIASKNHNPTMAPPSRPAEEWGPPLWNQIHSELSPSPEKLRLILNQLPCGECRHEAIEYIQKRPPDFGPDWPRWSWRWHNSLRRRQGKPVITWRSFQELYPAKAEVL